MDATKTKQAASGASAPPRWVWWLAPDLSLIVSIVVLVCIFTVLGGSGLFGDSDAGWHIRTGERILNGDGLPRTDSFSLLKAGEPWFAWEWGADVLMGFLHRRGGLAAVAAFYALVLAASVWLWCRLNTAMGGHFLITVAFTPLLLCMTWIHWHARPHLLSWLFLLAAVWYAERPRRSLWVVAVGSALWANIHASFFLGVVIYLLYAAGRLLRAMIWENTCDGHDWRNARWFTAAAVVAAVSTLANPYGWEVHRHALNFLGNSALLSHISEYQGFDYFQRGAAFMMLGLIAAAVGGVLSCTQRRPERAFLAIFFFAMAVRSARGLPIAAFLCLPVANAAMTGALGGAQSLRPWLRRKAAAFLQYGANFGRLDSCFAGPVTALIAVAVLVISVQNPSLASRARFSEQTHPVAAANYLAGLSISDLRLLSPDDYGGYLIYRFNGDLKVYFDGRSDFYGARYVRDYLDLIGLRPGWRDKVAKAGFTHALLPRKYSLMSALEDFGWKRLYEDDVAIILQAPQALPLASARP